tara:strand:- start:3083 stop:4219 length:1137 start_codon:yes stop_codon:yes gene_type:complete
MPKYLLPKHIAYTRGLADHIKFNFSDSTAHALTYEQLCAFSVDELNSILLSYSPVQGDVLLRQLIINFHQGLNCHRQTLEADNAVTFCGAQEALSAVYQALLDADDEIIVLTPSYPSLVTMAKTMGVVVKEIALCADNHWQVHIEDFSRLMTEKTRLIVLNSPHNPTGSIIDSALAEQVLQLAEQYQCYLLSDDVSQASNYHDLALAHRYLDYSKSIIVGVMSKSLGLAGVRIGWAVTPDDTLLNSLLAIKAMSSICCSKIDENLASIALRYSHEIIATNNVIIRDNIALFSAFINRYKQAFSWHPPQAGILALVEVKNIASMMAWSNRLVKKTGILALPSELFGLQGNYFRLGLGQKSFAQTLAIFEHYVNQQIKSE